MLLAYGASRSRIPLLSRLAHPHAGEVRRWVEQLDTARAALASLRVGRGPAYRLDGPFGRRVQSLGTKFGAPSSSSTGTTRPGRRLASRAISSASGAPAPCAALPSNARR